MPSAQQLTRTSPEVEGISSAAIQDFLRAVRQDDHPLRTLHGFMLLRHGNVAAEGWWEPYDPNSPHSLYSLSKSFTSSAIGVAVNEGLLTRDDPVLKFFPDDAPANPGDNLKAMRVRHLLSMNTGHHEDTTGHVFRGNDDNWPRAFLSLPVEHKPGTWFVYNTTATYMLSAIITRLTGETLLDYLRPQLFDPLGIENPTWDSDPRGTSIGGSGLHITTEDIARFGQLYLQRGTWGGAQLLPDAWVDEATSAHSDNSNTQSNPDWMVGYGYQFWKCRHGAYRADGAFGQFCIVMPEQDAVLAINSGLLDMQSVMEAVWEHLLPAMRAEPLPADGRAQDDLRDTLATLSLPLPEGQASSTRAAHWSGKMYAFKPSDLKLASITLTFDEDYDSLAVHNEHGEHTVRIGHGGWLRGTSGVLGGSDAPIAAAGAWTGEDTYELRVCYVEGEYCPMFRFHFASDALRLEVEPNVSWESPKVTTVIGRVTEHAG